MSRTRALSPALHVLFFFSGAAALGYQLVWTKMFSTGLGHEMPAVFAIVCAFMMGMALGAAAIDQFIPRHTRAGWWLAMLELTIGIWAVASSSFIPQVNELALRLIGISPGPLRHWAVAFALPAVALLPATAAMGATLPAMEKFLSAIAPERGSVGSVYAANTFGAMAGALMAPHVLMPAIGFSKSCWVLAALNGLAAAGAWLICASQKYAVRTESARGRRVASSARLIVTLFFTGLLGIAYETAAVRVLAQVFKNTVFTYAAILSVFLLGTAGGAAAQHRWWRIKERSAWLPALLCVTATAGFAGMILMAQAPGLYSGLRSLGDSRMAVFAAELLTAFVVLAAPTFCMGAMFSHLAEWARSVRGGIGFAVGINTLGASMAPALTGVLMIPALGTKWTLWAISSAYLLLLARKPRLSVAGTSLVACVVALSANLRLVSVPPGARVVHYSEGTMASVAVVEEGNGRTLRVDNSFQMGGTTAADAEYRQAHIPLLLHPAPRHALFLGLGTGISFGAATLYPQLAADGAELLPEVVNAMRFFEPQNFGPTKQAKLKIHVADARRFVHDATNRYDVIIGDVFHPYRDGAGALYTREHFAAVRRVLATNGIFCQWLPLHQLDESTLQVIIRTFQREFPSGEAWLLRFNVDVPVVGLVGAADRILWSTNLVESRADETLLGGELKRLTLADSMRLYGHLLADAEDLRIFAGEGRLNTDDNQRITLLAPRFAYQQNVRPYGSLLALLAVSKTVNASAVHLSPAHADFSARVTAYWKARNVYLRGLIDAAERRNADAVAAYIESARLSPEFTSGYAQCLTIVSIIANSDPTRAEQILNDLIAAQPERPVAREMLQRLFPR